MKTSKLAVGVVASLLISFNTAQAQAPVISSFSQNGVLVCTNLQPGTVASVEWASSLSGPWTNWAGAAGLDAVTVNSNTAISVSVPMFYRLRGVVYAPPGMVLIPAGSFIMGDNLDGESDAVPTSIYVSAFYMDTNLVSYSQWQTIYNWATNHGYGFDHAGSNKATNHPVQTVNWYDVVKWSNARSQQAGLTPVYYTDVGLTQVYTNGDTDAVYPNWTAKGYRLPTEAEWEKAARGGLVGQRFPWGLTISETQANFYAESQYSYVVGSYYGYNTNFTAGGEPYTSPVGFFAPNDYGLYDMAGNVFEWCWDWYGTPYGQPTINNPTGPASGGSRVLHGGSWQKFTPYVRCAFRGNNCQACTYSNWGFRCVIRQ